MDMIDKVISKLVAKNQKVFILPEKRLINGAKLCLLNAMDLLKVSKYAFSTRKYPLSISLSILAAEELSKGQSMLIMSVSAKNIIDWIMFWRFFRKHISKLTLFNSNILGINNHKLSDYIRQHSQSKQLSEDANKQKKNGFYVDFDEKANRFYRKRYSRLQARSWVNKVENEIAILSSMSSPSFKQWKKISEIMRESTRGYDKRIYDLIVENNSRGKTE